MRTQIPEFIHYNRSSGTISRTDRVYTDIKIGNNTKINYIIVPFTNLYNVISIERLPEKLKLEKIHDTFNNSFDINLSSPQLQVTGSNTPNLVLKRMLGHFLKIPPVQKILEFQE